MNLALYPSLKEEQKYLPLVSVTTLVIVGTPMLNHKHLWLEIGVVEV